MIKIVSFKSSLGHPVVHLISLNSLIQSNRLPTAANRLPTAANRLPTAANCLPIAANRLPTAAQESTLYVYALLNVV